MAMNHSSSSEDDDEVSTRDMCYMESNGVITSGCSRDYPVTFITKSFTINLENDVFIIQLNPMFVWRLLFSLRTLVDNEREFDFQRLRLYVLRLGRVIFIQIGPLEMCYLLDGVPIYQSSVDIFNSISCSYNRLSMAIGRKYDQTHYVNQLFASFVLMLRHMSSSWKIDCCFSLNIEIK